MKFAWSRGNLKNTLKNTIIISVETRIRVEDLDRAAAVEDLDGEVAEEGKWPKKGSGQSGKPTHQGSGHMRLKRGSGSEAEAA